MTFTSVLFIAFFLITLLLVRIVHGRARKYIILAANIIFYISSGIIGVFFLLGISLVCFAAGIWLDRHPNRKENAILPAVIGIGLILVLWLYHRTGAYYPLGLSFYSLMAVGYIINVYKGKYTAVTNFADFILCVSFFPIIQSGPIEDIASIAAQLSPDVRKDCDVATFDHDRRFFLFILWGFLEKISVSNIAGILVNEVFDNCRDHSALAILIATALYAFQLYADFDGYSNIAYGSAGLLGINIIQNFKQPYLSGSIREFWRRWHISLSTWLKDFVYIPLGGNRKGKLRKYLNLFITFVVSGLWHGTGLNFLVWGILHGIYQISEGILSHGKKDTSHVSILHKTFRVILTFILTDFAWFFFRANSLEDAVYMLGKFAEGKDAFPSIGVLLTELSASELTSIHIMYMIAALIVLIIIDLLRYKNVSLYRLYCKLPVIFRFAVCYMLIFWVILAGLSTMSMNMSGFIYGQF